MGFIHEMSSRERSDALASRAGIKVASKLWIVSSTDGVATLSSALRISSMSSLAALPWPASGLAGSLMTRSAHQLMITNPAFQTAPTPSSAHPGGSILAKVNILQKGVRI